MEWYLKVLKEYANFEGRARRKEYWMFVLFNLLFAFVAGFIDGFVFGGKPFLYGIYVLGIFIPALAVAVRRLHDVGKSGWMLLVALIPIVGGIWLLVLFASEGQPGDNQYGPNPKEEGFDVSSHLVE